MYNNFDGIITKSNGDMKITGTTNQQTKKTMKKRRNDDKVK